MSRKLTPKEVAIQDIAKEVKKGNFKQNYLRVEKKVKDLCKYNPVIMIL